MYKYTETDENAVSLHDCRASGLSYGTGYIAFTFSEGIYVMENCVHNHNKKLSYTGEAEMRFTGFTWKDAEWNITIYIFTETEDDKKQIREEITLSSLTDMINGGAELEFTRATAHTHLSAGSCKKPSRITGNVCLSFRRTRQPSAGMIYMLNRIKDKYIGTREFYISVLHIAVPMMLQNLVTNFVSMIDNIMVGQIGTEQMSGVSIVNQFIFVFNVTVFGAVSGPSIFGAQFFGKKDHTGHCYTFRFRVLICVLISVIGILFFGAADTSLISLFLSKDDSPAKIADTLMYGRDYMRIMLIALIPFGIGQAYTSAVRECGETRIPMIGAISAVGINLLLDYGLIFGRLGMPEMGVRGAAAATVAAKFIEAAVVIVWTHTHPDRNKYIVGVYKSIAVPLDLVKKMVIKGFPLLVNEFLWAAGVSVIAQCYSAKGLDVVAARNISGTITNLFGAIYLQLGVCTAILVGPKLGANKLKEARELGDRMRIFSVAVSSVLMLMIIPLSPLFPQLYNTEPQIRALASYMIIIQALALPLWSYTNACYFTLRSGGKTGITFLFDFCSTWLLMIPLAFVLTYLTDLDIHVIFAAVTYTEALKVIAGYFMVRSDIWIVNMVGTENTEKSA